MKRLGVFLLPPGWDASPSQGYPQHFIGTHLYTWVERGTVRVKCLAQEHNTMSPARTRTRTTRSGAKHSNHGATAEEKGMISLQVPTSLCMQNKLIMHLRHCFVEQCVYPRESNIYMANLYLRDDQKWISFSLSLAPFLSFFSLSLFFALFAHTMFFSFRSSFPLSIPL